MLLPKHEEIEGVVTRLWYALRSALLVLLLAALMALLMITSLSL